MSKYRITYTVTVERTVDGASYPENYGLQQVRETEEDNAVDAVILAFEDGIADVSVDVERVSVQEVRGE